MEEKIEKIKITGGLFTFKEVIALIRDILIIIFLIVGIIGTIVFIQLASQVKLPF